MLPFTVNVEIYMIRESDIVNSDLITTGLPKMMLTEIVQ